MSDSKLAEIELQLSRITEILEHLSASVDEVKEMVRKNNTSCERMDNHINFVEETYRELCASRPITMASRLRRFITGE